MQFNMCEVLAKLMTMNLKIVMRFDFFQFIFKWLFMKKMESNVCSLFSLKVTVFFSKANAKNLL